MSETVLLGKAELLAWAANATAITPCDKYGDLKDGLVYLALARLLFPGEIDSAIVRLQRRGARDSAKNWSLLTSCLRRHGIPTHLCNRQAVERGHTRHCFNLLVLFYFLVRLSRGERFAADFAQPVDPHIAAFLQSPESVVTVERGASSGTGEALMTIAGGEADERVTAGATHAVTRLASPPSAAAAAAVGATEAAAAAAARLASWTAASACASPALRGRPLPGAWGTAYAPPPAHDWSSAWVSREGEGEAAASHARATESRGAPPMTAALHSSRSSVSSALAAHLHTENRLLREELHHVQAVSQLLLTQQRGSEAAAEMRAADALQGALAKAELQHLHDVRQLQVALSAASAPGGGGHAPQSWAALEHRAETAEAAAVQLYHESDERQQQYESTLQQLRQVFISIRDIATVTRTSTSWDSASTEYEEGVAAAIMAQLSGVPAVQRDAVHAQLGALLLTLRALRTTNARLQLDSTVERGRSDGDAAEDTMAVGEPCVSSSRPLSLSLTHEAVASARAEAVSASGGASVSTRRTIRRLLDLLDTLSGDLACAEQDRDALEQRCRCAEAAAAEAVAASRGSAERLSRDAQERGALAERTLRANQRLCREVEEVLTTALSTPGSRDMRWAGDRLTSLIGAYVDARPPSSAMEEALAEQAETIAALRTEVRRHREGRERLEAQLRDVEHQRQALEHRCASLQPLSGAEQRHTLQGESQTRRTLSERASTSTGAALVATPLARTPESAVGDATVRDSTPRAPIGESRLAGRGVPRRDRAYAPHPFPHQLGALRSPTGSDDGDVRDVTAAAAAARPRVTGPEHDAINGAHHLRDTSLSPCSSASASPSSFGTAAAVDGVDTLKVRSPVVSTRDSTMTSSSAGAGPSLLLSAAELERRKQAIMRKYDVA
ncbi:hypothetical protein NESM_000101300 [Novymonas esmeraldas]|uniref:Calponin-homology (CH) domain-containing protein n=1 Tax=Novymonas esmeraldas TaxID=1808958 RepID=A0AAW0F3T8_9TRYP